MTDIDTLGKFLRHLRDKAELQQNQVAPKIGISRSGLSEIETDSRPISAARLSILLETYGATEAQKIRALSLAGSAQVQEGSASLEAI